MKSFFRLYIIFSFLVFLFFLVGCQKKAVTPVFVRPKTSSPKETPPADSSKDFSEDESFIEPPALGNSEKFVSFIPLLKTETLLSTLTCDVNSDTLDDQIIVVKNSASPFINLVVGLYDGASNTYQRASVITTSVSKQATFTFSVLDLIGNHTFCIFWQGITDDGTFAFRAYTYKKSLKNIADITADLSIDLDTPPRSIEYEEGSLGSPAVITARSKARDGVQKITYEYSFDKEAFTETSRVVEKKQEEVKARTSTFTDFIAGLWVSTGLNPHQIFFDCDNKEVILITGDTQGVYNWEELGRAKNGTYLSCGNAIIQSMKMRFDITIVSLNEVSVRVHENVGMVSSIGNSWDGNYKKLPVTDPQKEEPKHIQFQKRLTLSKWTDDRGNEYSFSKNDFHIKRDKAEATGLFIMDTVGGFPCVQFKSSAGVSTLLGSYAMQFETMKITGTEGRSVVNEDIIYFIPVRLGALECTPSEGMTVILHKKEEISAEDRARLQKTRILRLTL